jgi:uncharacterized protein YjeT (DUF2065 family)
MSIAWPDFVAALGLMLVVEGIFPFLNPRGIKRVFATMATMDDGALRIAGVVSMLAGLLLLWLIRS